MQEKEGKLIEKKKKERDRERKAGVTHSDCMWNVRESREWKMGEWLSSKWHKNKNKDVCVWGVWGVCVCVCVC